MKALVLNGNFEEEENLNQMAIHNIFDGSILSGVVMIRLEVTEYPSHIDDP